MEVVQLLTNFPPSEAGLKLETESFPALPTSCLLESVHEPQLWLWALGCLSSPAQAAARCWWGGAEGSLPCPSVPCGSRLLWVWHKIESLRVAEAN